MPTGYTAGILDGTTKDFKAFAQDCMRAFGACMHMRDDSTKAEYKPQEVGDYHGKAIDKAKLQLDYVSKMPDNDLLKMHVSDLTHNKIESQKRIIETEGNVVVLKQFLEKARSWTPPTSEHNGVKEFMVKQISDTIDFDGSTKYYRKRLSEIDAELSSLDVAQIRKSKIDHALKDIEYHTNELDKEKMRVSNANKWVDQFLNSLS